MVSETHNKLKIHQPIIPVKPLFHQKSSNRSYDLRSVAAFVALGFFPGKGTFYKEVEALQPATDYEQDDAGKIISEKKWWDWHYQPRDINLKQATEEFAHLLEKLVQETTGNDKIILPLSGGLDSRTLAIALGQNKNVHAFSYEFENGFKETEIGRKLSLIAGFSFDAFTVPRGYLWNVIEEIAKINSCYAEFTNARQMAFVEDYAGMGDRFLLGHWGDVLFDNVGVLDNLSSDEQISLLMKKVIRKGGKELAEALWQAWGITGSFTDYLRSEISKMLGGIKIDNANARMRAFKSMYWAPRWTSTNIAVFSSVKPVSLPYYHDEMCKFICTVPEPLLSKRKIQIEYIKMKSPAMAAVSWQANKPFNLFSYPRNKAPYNLPFRFQYRIRNEINKLAGKQLIQRNWEIQFKGSKNDEQLKTWLFENKSMNTFVPVELTRDFYNRFTTSDSIYWSHPVSMLLTLSLHRKLNP